MVFYCCSHCFRCLVDTSLAVALPVEKQLGCMAKIKVRNIQVPKTSETASTSVTLFFPDDS